MYIALLTIAGKLLEIIPQHRTYLSRIGCCLVLVNIGTYLYLYPLGWHTLPSHANAEACLTSWPNA